MRNLAPYFIIPFTWLLMAGGLEYSGRSVGQAVNTAKADSLFQKVQQLDSQLFEAFNRRDTVVFAAMFSKELEFFHDKGGLTGYGETTGFLQSTIRNGSDLQRTLVPGTWSDSDRYP